MLPIAGVLVGVQLWDSAWSLWWRPTGLFFVSYFLQWLGHRIEGNEMGEVVLIKRWLGRPYVAISPRFAAEAPGRRRASKLGNAGPAPSPVQGENGGAGSEV